MQKSRFITLIGNAEPRLERALNKFYARHAH